MPRENSIFTLMTHDAQANCRRARLRAGDARHDFSHAVISSAERLSPFHAAARCRPSHQKAEEAMSTRPTPRTTASRCRRYFDLPLRDTRHAFSAKSPPKHDTAELAEPRSRATIADTRRLADSRRRRPRIAREFNEFIHGPFSFSANTRSPSHFIDALMSLLTQCILYRRPLLCLDTAAAFPRRHRKHAISSSGNTMKLVLSRHVETILVA